MAQDPIQSAGIHSRSHFQRLHTFARQATSRPPLHHDATTAADSPPATSMASDEEGRPTEEQIVIDQINRRTRSGVRASARVRATHLLRAAAVWALYALTLAAAAWMVVRVSTSARTFLQELLGLEAAIASSETIIFMAAHVDTLQTQAHDNNAVQLTLLDKTLRHEDSFVNTRIFLDGLTQRVHAMESELDTTSVALNILRTAHTTPYIRRPAPFFVTMEQLPHKNSKCTRVTTPLDRSMYDRMAAELRGIWTMVRANFPVVCAPLVGVDACAMVVEDALIINPVVVRHDKDSIAKHHIQSPTCWGPDADAEVSAGTYMVLEYYSQTGAPDRYVVPKALVPYVTQCLLVLDGDTTALGCEADALTTGTRVRDVSDDGAHMANT